MYKNKRKYNATVTRGEARILQGDGSDVSLAIPEGAPGVYKTRVHTDQSRFKGLIPDDECLVGPLVEVVQRDLKSIKLQVEEMNSPYILKIPHCVAQCENWRFIKVRKGSIYKQKPFTEISSQDTSDGGTFFTIDSHFITIFTYHFCLFTCTMCKQSCPAAATVFLGGSITTEEEEKTTDVEIKPFLCSFLYQIKDFKKVGSIGQYCTS